jgi:hypothetical protein
MGIHSLTGFPSSHAGGFAGPPPTLVVDAPVLPGPATELPLTVLPDDEPALVEPDGAPPLPPLFALDPAADDGARCEQREEAEMPQRRRGSERRCGRGRCHSDQISHRRLLEKTRKVRKHGAGRETRPGGGM